MQRTFFLMPIMAILLGTPWSSSAGDAAPDPGQRVVLVTGSTNGLGKAIARELGRRGDHVIVHGRNAQRGEALVAEINAAGKGSARFYRADFASLDEVGALAEAIAGDYERLDILVNNAGIFRVNDPERRVSEDGYELHFQVNYLAGYLLSKRLMPLLEASAPSRIVNVASGQMPVNFDDLMLESDYSWRQAYFQSKNAQIMMTFAWADELARRGITINVLHPSSLMDTEGVIATGIEPESSVLTGRDAVIQLIDDDVGTGRFFNVFAEDRAIGQAYDEEAQARLLDISEKLVAGED